MKGDRHTMKSLILTIQDARELDKLGGLTITKPIKPAPRYIEGASFSREADCADIWHLVGQDGNRLGAGDGVADVFASPVEVSDVVFIREPWYRLKNPQGGESERVILAADSVVQPEQAAYKWASPVSMPQDAARRFARVKSIEPAYYRQIPAREHGPDDGDRPSARRSAERPRADRAENRKGGAVNAYQERPRI